MTDQQPEERVVIHDRRRIDPATGAVKAPAGSPGGSTAGAASETAPAGPGQRAAAGPDDGAVAAQLAERTADLQRVTAEYANYRKRVDRDRQAVVESATGAVLVALLPVLDDIDRARQHGDLTGAFKAVADQLEATLEKLGLQPYGSEGDRFDPTLHEAVVHQTSPDVTEPTCVAVLRRGYRLGDRLLRVPLVAVAEPGPAEPAAADPGAVPAAAGPGAVPGPAGPAPAEPAARAGGEPATGAGEPRPAAEWFGDGGSSDDRLAE